MAEYDPEQCEYELYWSGVYRPYVIYKVCHCVNLHLFRVI